VDQNEGNHPLEPTGRSNLNQNSNGIEETIPQNAILAREGQSGYDESQETVPNQN